MKTRKRWVTVMKVVLAVVVVLGIVHGIALFVTGRRVEAELARIKASGGAISMHELAGNVPDEDNAALVYQKAFEDTEADKKIRSKVDALRYDLLDRDKTPTPDTWAAARAWTARHQGAIALAAEAVSKPKCRFKTDWDAGISANMSYFAKLRELTRLVVTNAVVSAKDGRMDDAVSSLETGFGMGDSLREEPTLIGLLVRVSMLDAVSVGLRRVAEYGDLTDSQAIQLAGRISEDDFDRGYKLAMNGERTFGIWVCDAIRTHRIGANELLGANGILGDNDSSLRAGRALFCATYLGRPFLYADELVYLRLMERQIGRTNLPYREAVKPDPEFESYLRTNPLVACLAAALPRVTMNVDKARVAVRGDRIMLALIAHRSRFGAYPASIADLKPQGLKINLEDPFSDKDLVYKTQGKGFVLYSVGPNFKDDKGLDSSDKPVPPTGEDKRPDDIVWRMSK